MKCPYCAEEIQDAAILCRFCGARREGGTAEGKWLEPLYKAPPNAPINRAVSTSTTNFTIASSGWLLMASGVGCLISLASPVAIGGVLYEGAIAVLYNLTFVGLFGAMGFALAYRKPWALPITFATSIAYTLDKLEVIFNETAVKALLADYGDMLGDMEPIVQQVMVFIAILFIGFWWAFVGYLFIKRSYFLPNQGSTPRHERQPHGSDREKGKQH